MKITDELKTFHALCHIEYSAVIAYAQTLALYLQKKNLPAAFVHDMGRIIADEGEHCYLLETVLNSMNSCYGDIPVNSNIKDHIEKTNDDLISRLCMISLINEGKGLDAGPRLLEKLVSYPQWKYKILEKIVKDEESHVNIGKKWFLVFCEEESRNPKVEIENLLKVFQIKFPPNIINEMLKSQFHDIYKQKD